MSPFKPFQFGYALIVDLAASLILAYSIPVYGTPVRSGQLKGVH